MLRTQRTTILCTMLLALGACKVSVSTSAPDASRPNVAPEGDEGVTPGDTLVDNGQTGDEAEEGGDGDETTKAPADPSSTLSQGEVATCDDGAHKAGETWKVDCNTCSCKNGQAVCTRMGCTDPAPAK